MKLDPFPPPQPIVCEAFGRTAFYAQKFEKELMLYLLAAHHAGRIQITSKKSLSPEQFLDGQTLGLLLRELQKHEKLGNWPIDQHFHDLLQKAVDDRNYLMHQLLQHHDPATASEQEIKELCSECGRIRLSVGNAYLMIREFRKQAEKLIGFTEEDLQQIVRGLL